VVLGMWVFPMSEVRLGIESAPRSDPHALPGPPGTQNTPSQGLWIKEQGLVIRVQGSQSHFSARN